MGSPNELNRLYEGLRLILRLKDRKISLSATCRIPSVSTLISCDAGIIHIRPALGLLMLVQYLLDSNGTFSLVLIRTIDVQGLVL